MRNFLSEISLVTDGVPPVDQAGHRVTLSLHRFDDRNPIMVGDIVKPKRNTMACQDVPDRDAEGRPRKLNEGEHGVLYERSEAKPQAPMGALIAAGAQEDHTSKASRIT